MDGPSPRLFKTTGARITPQVEWVEVQTKSVINAVQGMPFKWSINPYRGCQHQCVFCVAPETGVLMADGSHRLIGNVRPGDAVYGTVRQGAYRRFVRTRVLAHWETRKPAHQITLENGTRLIASGDHRFLTERGWKFVSGSEQGPNLRPYLTVDTQLVGLASFAGKHDIEGEAADSNGRFSVTAIEALNGEQTLFDITTGTGDFIANGVVSHNCYARRTHWFLDQDGVNDWGSRIFVKVNAPDVLRRELAHPSWSREEVHIGTATDPYQPAEGAYRITRQILEALRDYKTPASIVTRSTMVVRDRDILRLLADGPGALVCFSIATMDPVLAREIEPDVPPPQRRLEALRALAQAGVPTAVLLAPVLPHITDHPKQLAAVVEAAKEYGASSLWTNALHLGDVTRQAFFQYLGRSRAELVSAYERLYRGKYAPGAYRRHVQEVVSALKSRYGFHEPVRAHTPAPRPPAQQLTLW